MTSIYQHAETSPFHISVGAVLVNDAGKICAHRNTLESVPAEYRAIMGGLTEAYILMRESLEEGETLEEAVLRGVREEFGAEGTLVKYLGSIQIMVHAKSRSFEKTTLYFQVALTQLGNERSLEDFEGETEMVWETPEFLIEKMKDQGASTDREDLDESKILEAYIRYS